MNGSSIRTLILCAAAITSSLAMPRCIRILMHLYGSQRPQPVYLGETARLQGAIKIAIDGGLPAADVAWLRVAIAAVLLVAVAWRELGTLRGRWGWIWAYAVAEISIRRSSLRFLRSPRWLPGVSNLEPPGRSSGRASKRLDSQW